MILPFPVIGEQDLAKLVHINDDGNMPGLATHVVDGRFVFDLAKLHAIDARTYRAGRQREIELTNAALALLPCVETPEQRSVLGAGAAPDHVETDAAARAGLSLAAYRRLVAWVDSILKKDSNGVDPDERRLDSLRVTLTVLRTRVSAEQARQPSTNRRVSCSAHS